MTLRLATLTAWSREFVLPALVLTCLASGYAGVDLAAEHPSSSAETSAASPANTRLANTRIVRALPSIAYGSADITGAAGAMARKPSSDTLPASHEPQPVVIAALTDTSEELPAGISLKQEPDVNPAANAGTGNPDLPVSLTDAGDACPNADTAVDPCTDRYLWALYQRAPKQDNAARPESRTVTVKKKGKLVTVTKTFMVDAEEDFSWKDPKAAEAAGMKLMDYVIGGMDREFKQRLSRLLRAAERAGLSPGITSAFRDDYRQSIASGLKASNNRSYHGGSLRGGYGHGLAADIVSVNGETRDQRLASTRVLWRWVDAHGKEFGIGRPYLGKDPMHVAPIDGQEWAVHRLGKPDLTLASVKPAA